MLTCSCDEWDGGEWWYSGFPPDFTEAPATGRRKKCCSCNELINFCSDRLVFGRFREPRNDVEEAIWGDEVQIADWYMCEKCGEIALNLEVLGYCIYLGDDMRGLLREYWELTGFSEAKK